MTVNPNSYELRHSKFCKKDNQHNSGVSGERETKQMALRPCSGNISSDPLVSAHKIWKCYVVNDITIKWPINSPLEESHPMSNIKIVVVLLPGSWARSKTWLSPLDRRWGWRVAEQESKISWEITAPYNVENTDCPKRMVKCHRRSVYTF